MRRFQFHLARVRDYRRQQLDMEEVKLQSILAERRALEYEAERLNNERAETSRSLMVTASAESQDLAALDAYRRHLEVVRARHAAKLQDCQARILKQQQAITEAKRRVRLMETLEERQFREWRAGIDREQENLLSELYLAQWNRN